MSKEQAVSGPECALETQAWSRMLVAFIKHQLQESGIYPVDNADTLKTFKERYK